MRLNNLNDPDLLNVLICIYIYNRQTERTKTHRTTEEEMEGPILFWGYKEQESNLILPEHDDDDKI